MVATHRPLFDSPVPMGRDSTRLRGLLTADGPRDGAEFAEACRIETEWELAIRTATVRGRVIDRAPLGTLAESCCLQVAFQLARPVPLEPGLRFRVVSVDDPQCQAAGVVGPMELDPPGQGDPGDERGFLEPTE